MRLTHILGNRAGTRGVLMAMAVGTAALQAAGTEQGFAKVRYVVGQVTCLRGGGQWEPVERNMFLRGGDVVKTGPNSHVDMWLANNNGNIHVEADSELALDKLIFTYTGFEIIHDTQLNLRSGAVAGVVRKMATGSKYEIKTPRGVAGIRGSRYRITAIGDLTMTEGTGLSSLVMADGSIKTFTVPSGHILVAATGEVRAATYYELKTANDAVSDGITHGGGSAAMDEEDRKFFLESQWEPYVSPVMPGDALRNAIRN